METSFSTTLKNTLLQFFEIHKPLSNEILTRGENTINEASYLPLLLANKFLNKSLANEFSFSKRAGGIFGLSCEIKVSSILERQEVQIALDKAREEISEYTWNLSAQTIIDAVKEAISEVPQSDKTLSPLSASYRIIHKLDNAPSDGFGCIEGCSDEGVIDLTDSDNEDIWFSNDTLDGSQNSQDSTHKSLFSQGQHTVRITNKDFTSASAPDMKELLNQSCWQICAQSIKDGLLTSTLNTTATAKGSQQPVKKLVQLTPSLLLSAILGSPNTVNSLANAFSITPSEIQFPTHIHQLRNELMEFMITKTFESYENGQRKETHWIAKAEEQKHLLALSQECQHILELISKIQSNALTHEELLSYNCTENWKYIGEEFGKFIQLNTAHPRSRIQKLSSLQSVQHRLNSQVLGQRHAVDAMSAVVSKMLFKNTESHIGISTFLGPSGSGKTFLAEKFTDSLNKTLSLGYQCKILNMEHYVEDKDVMKLWGSGSQYVNSEYGELTATVAKNPYQVIVLDELEKAHKSVIQSFLTLIDKGYAIDRTTDRTVDFSRCIFIATTNLGAKTIEHLSDLDVEMDVKDLLTNSNEKNTLSSEMVNRLAAGNIVLFKKLTAAQLIQLATKASDEFMSTSAVDWRVNELPRLIMHTLGGDISPRNIKTQAEKLEGAILSKAMSCIPKDEFSKLQNISASCELAHSFDELHIVLFSNNEKMSKYMTKLGVHCHDVRDIETMKSIMKAGADCFIFDDKSVDIDANKLHNMLTEYSHALCYLITSTFESTLASLNRSHQVFQHIFPIATRTKAVLSQELNTITLNTQLIATVDERLKRNMKADYSIEIKPIDTGIEAIFKDFSFKPTFSQNDLLQFLTFDGTPDVCFDDVQGLDSAKQDLRLVINYMRNTSYLAKRNTTIAKGCVLAGQPGTGKTMLAKALATECGVSFFNVNSADLLSGNIVENINTLFDVVEKNAPAILFFDEIDAIAQNRSKGSDLNRVAVNTLLVRLDGFTIPERPVFIAAASNHPELLEPALMRSGRLEKHIYCGLPNADNRKAFIKKQLTYSNCQFSTEELDEVTQLTSGASIATLSKMIRESFYTEIKTEKEWTIESLIEEIRIAKFGNIRNDLIQAKEEIKVTAYHEAGHLVAYKLLFPDAKVELASVQPRGAALGMIVPGENGFTGNLNKQQIKNHLQVLLAGLASEHLQGLVGNQSLSGAFDDRKKATNLAKRAIVEWGMSEEFGWVIPSQLNVNECKLTYEVNEWLSAALDDVTKLLEDNTLLLTTVAKALINRESLNATEIDDLFTDNQCSSGFKLAC